MSAIARLIEAIGRVYSGDPWHGPATREVLSGIKADEAAIHPVPAAHSIWEIVLHMTAWMGEVERRLEGGAPAQPRAGDWPAVPVVSEATWLAAQEALATAHESLLQAVAAFPEESLAQTVGGARDLPLGTGVSYEEMLRGLIQHNVYHTGQIALLKRASKDV